MGCFCRFCFVLSVIVILVVWRLVLGFEAPEEVMVFCVLCGSILGGNAIGFDAEMLW
ncbi:hypothetical protein TSUD_272820 [Trifolium subterraneum]|uniref:Uncharacterized protein n=1 Tax=Trifolium subterraneum TaxID=3900 RepID=A0A2Z6NPM1_TRISU|nr:hypothetical protein TSUD_272820 [Trifolium subterraneum]